MFFYFFFFKQKTAYEIDLCLEFSRVLFRSRRGNQVTVLTADWGIRARMSAAETIQAERGPLGWTRAEDGVTAIYQIGRASCRERGEISGVAGAVEQKREKQTGTGETDKREG